MSRWRVIHGDCLDVLKALDTGSVDAVVTDPPYGISYSGNGISNACEANRMGSIVGDDEPFDPTPWMGFSSVCLWGANHYASRLPDAACWLVWDKRDGHGSNMFADCEMAWTNRTTPARCFAHRWMGMVRESERGPRVHPTQKPVALMRWVLDQMDIPDGATVLDPYMGSGSTGVACMQTGRNFIGIEIDEGYCAIARRRISEAANHLFVPTRPDTHRTDAAGDAPLFTGVTND